MRSKRPSDPIADAVTKVEQAEEGVESATAWLGQARDELDQQFGSRGWTRFSYVSAGDRLYTNRVFPTAILDTAGVIAHLAAERGEAA